MDVGSVRKDFPTVRNGKGVLVNGETKIEPGDIVVVFCHGAPISKIEKYFK